MSNIPQIQLTLIGDGACGKTTSVLAWQKKEKNDDYIPTVVENYVTNISINGKEVSLKIVDTAGQEDFSNFRTQAYPGTNCFILLHDLSTPKSFDNAMDLWLNEINEHDLDIPVILCGNKKDLRDDYITVQELGKPS